MDTPATKQDLHNLSTQEANQTQESLGQSKMDDKQPTELNNNGTIINIKKTGEKAHHFGYLGPDLIELFSMRYRNFRIKIFKQPTTTPVKFFYEPILLIDPQKIQSQVNSVTSQAYVRFLVQMWDEQVEGQVLNLLKQLPDSGDVQDHCVQAMPFEKVRLVFREDNIPSTAYRLPEQSRFCAQLPQSLQFHLLCDTKEAADSLVESFRTDPEYWIKDLALECTIKSVLASVDEPHRKKQRLTDGTGGPVTALEIAQFSTILDFNIDTSVDVTPADKSTISTRGIC